MQERRKAVRTRSYLGGEIAFNKRRSTMNCLVRNISSRGAKLDFTNTGTTPEEFDLTIPHKEQSRRVRVIWRRGTDELGVSFVEPVSQESAAQAPVIPLDLARRVRDLEADKAALQRRIAALGSE